MRIPYAPAISLLLAAVTLAAAAAAAAAAQVPAPACRGPLQRKQIAELMFGRSIGGRAAVSEAAWRRFVAREITPRFPDGLTIINAIGQWRDPRSGVITRELSKEVEIVLPGNDDEDARLAAVVAAYKRQFRQRSVGVIVLSGCVSF
jgi:Protein of unknown function (DUF3574)